MENSLFSLDRDSLLRPPDWRSQFASRLPSAPDPTMTLFHTLGFGDAPLIYYIGRRHNIWTRHTNWILGADGWTGLKGDSYGDGIREAEDFRARTSPWNLALTDAWILTAMSDEEVAAKTGMSPKGVKWYERLYFHCRDRLSQDIFVRHCILNSWAVTPTPAGVIRSYGYFGGRNVVELVLRHWDGTPHPEWDKVDPDLDPRAARERLTVLISVMLRLMPMVGQTTPRDLREWLRLKATVDTLVETDTGPPDPDEKGTSWLEFSRTLWSPESETEAVPEESIVESSRPDSVETQTTVATKGIQPSGARRKAQHNPVSAC